MRQAIARTSFAGGEVSSRVANRLDLAKYPTAVARAENVCVETEGTLTRRPGTRMVTPVVDEAATGRLVPFAYEPGDNYDLVFNGTKLRFIRQGGVVLDAGVPYEIAQPYAEAELAPLAFCQVGNLVFLANGVNPPQVLTRVGHTDWSIAAYVSLNGPVKTINTDAGLTLQATAVSGSISLTANTSRFTPGDVGAVIRIDEESYEAVPLWTAGESITTGAQRRHDGMVYEALDTATDGDDPPTHDFGDYRTNGAAGIRWRYLHSGYGFARITSVGSNPSTVAQATVTSRLPDSVVSAPTSKWWAGAWSDGEGWPDNVRLHNGRLVWCKGDFVWMTRPGDFFDFHERPGYGADSGLSVRVTDPQGQRVDVRWVLSAKVLVIGAASAEWSLRGDSPFDAITVDNVRAIDEDTNGSAPHQPARADVGAVFIGKSRKRLHFLQFDTVGEGQVAIDELTIAHRNVLDPGAVGVCYQRDPLRILWVRLSDGSLRSCTLVPKHDVVGWSRHPMPGAFVEDFCVTPGGDGEADTLTLLVRREIDGVTRRFVEILQPFFEPADPDAPTAEGAWYVDCGLSYSGAPETVFAGLEHLEGATVRIFADGSQRPDQVVDGGSVTLTQPASEVVIGLPIAYRIRSLDFVRDTPTGSSKGRQQQAKAVAVDVVDAIGGELRSNDGPPEDLFQTGTLAYGAPLPLSTRTVLVPPASPSEPHMVLELSGDNALPMTLAGWTPDIDVSEG